MALEASASGYAASKAAQEAGLAVSADDLFRTLDADLHQCLEALVAQIAHSKQQREIWKARPKLEESVRGRGESTVDDADSVASPAGLDEAPRKTARRRAQQNSASPRAAAAREVADADSRAAASPSPASPSAGSPVSAAEQRRQRQLERQQQKEEQERRAAEEAAARQAAQQEGAQEKGCWFQSPGFMGWKKYFVVARKSGLYWYSTEPKGRGNVRGDVTYDASAKHDGFLEWEFEQKDSRGRTEVRKCVLEKNLTSEDDKKCPARNPDSSGNWYFGVQYPVKDKDTYAWHVLRAATAQDRDEMCAFISPRFCTMRRSLGGK